MLIDKYLYTWLLHFKDCLKENILVSTATVTKYHKFGGLYMFMAFLKFWPKAVVVLTGLKLRCRQGWLFQRLPTALGCGCSLGPRCWNHLARLWTCLLPLSKVPCDDVGSTWENPGWSPSPKILNHMCKSLLLHKVIFTGSGALGGEYFQGERGLFSVTQEPFCSWIGRRHSCCWLGTWEFREEDCYK